MLSVLYGPFQPDLEAAFVAKLRELAARPRRGPVLIVAPSRRMADRLERLAAVETGLSLVGFRFHTFHSLALEIVDEEGLGELALVSDPVFHDRVVDELLREGGFFGVSASGYRPRALAGAVRASLRDLIDAGVSAEDIAENFGEAPVESEAERKRLAALLALSSAYERRLSELKVCSSSGVTREAARRCGDSRVLAAASEVLYYGFYDLTGLQLDFFEAVAARCETTLFFPYRRAHPAFRFADELFEEKLLARAKPAPPAGASPAAAAALDSLFRPEAAPAALGDDALRVISASGARDELWACAKEIARLVAEGYCAYEDVAVLARSLEPYRAAAAEVFAENEIPVDLRADEPLLRHPLAKCCFHLLMMRRRDFPAAAALDLLGSPYFKDGRAGWRRLIEELGIRGGFLQWQGKLEARAAKDADAASLWELVSSWREELSRPGASWSDLSRRCETLLERRLRPVRPTPEESEVWEAVLSCVRSLAGFDRLGSVPRMEEFLECLEEKLRRASRPTASGARGVRVLDVMDARGDAFGVTFLLGLKERFFPRQIEEDALLRDATRDALRRAAGYSIARKLAGYDEERLLFYLAAASARKRFYCVYPRSDESGKAEVPSLYLRELCRCAGLPFGERERRVPRQPADRLRESALDSLSPRELSLRLSLDGGDAPGALDALGRADPLLSAGLAALPRLNARGAPGPFDGIVGEPADYLERWRRRGVSPKALDAFAECPFAFFAQRLLELGSDDDALELGDFDGKTRGTIYHAILERFHGGAPLDGAIEAVFQENDWKRLGLYPVLWRAAKEAMTENLRAFVAWDEARLRELGLRPLWREKELSGELPGGGGLKLAGKIDRIDADAEGRKFWIVDYKSRWWGGLRSSSQGRLAAEIAKGGMHQMPVYAELARQALGPGAEFLGASLRALEESPETTGLPREQRYDAAQEKAEAPAFWARVREAVGRISSGRFPISPQDGEFGRCARCEFSGVCRKGHGPSRQRAQAA